MKETSANDSLEDLFDEAVCLIDDSPMEHSLPEAGKTPTTPVTGNEFGSQSGWGQWGT